MSWRIRDGVLETIPDARRQCDLWTAREYEEFALDFDWKVAPGANSGVKYLIQANATDQLRPEPPRSRRSLQLPASNGAPARPAGEWNTARLVLRGDQVEHWINGRRLLGFSLWPAELKAALALRRVNSARMMERLARRKTPIAFQHHESAAAFLNIRIYGPGSK